MIKNIVTYGQVSFASEQIEQLSIQHEAMVKQVFVVNGQEVKQNDPLLLLGPSINFQATIEDAKLAAEFAKKDYKRLSELLSQYLATNAEVQTAAQNLGKAEIRLRTLQNQKQSQGGEVLKADFAGTVISVSVQTDQIIAANTPLLNFSKGKDREIRLGVETEDLNEVKEGQKVVISTLQNKNIEKLGRVKAITGQVNPTTGLLDLIVYLKNAPDFVPGSLVRGDIITQTFQKVLTVPHSAVLYHQKRAYVFVINQGKAQQRRVLVGLDDGQMISIKHGLKEGEKVVTMGNYELSDGMNVVVENK